MTTLDATTSTDALQVRPRQRFVTDYADLAQRVRDAGLMRRRPVHYAIRAGLLAAAFGGVVATFLTLGDSWWQLLLAAGLGLLLTQVAYLGHDAAHRQIFRSGRRNELAALLLGNVVVGLSHGWWMSKHSRHHANPNKVDVDPDVEASVLVFTSDVAAERRVRQGFGGWWVRHQGTVFFPLLLLAGLNMHVNGLRTVFGRGRVKFRAVEIPLLLARLVLYPVALFTLLSPGIAAAFLAVQLAVFGVSMGATFAPNHKGMPMIPKDLSLDYLRRQVLTSRNVRGGRFVDVAMGGLNHQIEHHLFPSMPSSRLRAAGPVVRRFCAERGVPYAEAGVLESWRIVVEHLNRVGTTDVDLFECPMAARLRAPA